MPGDKCRILVVEDDSSTCAALSWLANHMGHEVQSAMTLQIAYSKLGWNPTLLILDLMLPDGNGVELLRQIRRDNLPIKVAVTTGMDSPETLSEVQALHPEVYLRKPIDLKQLEKWLSSGGQC